MQELTVGVLGGMGPDATVDFMARVLDATEAGSDQDHIRLLVEHNPKVPNRQRALLDKAESPVPALVSMAARLEAMDCDFLVMPCNTAHAFATDIRAAAAIPLLSIIDVTMAAVLASGHRGVGLLASAACLDSSVYQDAFAAAGLRPVLPSSAELAELTALLAAIKRGDHGAGVASGMLALTQSLIEQGAPAIVLGCTEIPLVLDPGDLDVPVFSSTALLAAATVRLAKGLDPLPRS